MANDREIPSLHGLVDDFYPICYFSNAFFARWYVLIKSQASKELVEDVDIFLDRKRVAWWIYVVDLLGSFGFLLICMLYDQYLEEK